MESCRRELEQRFDGCSNEGHAFPYCEVREGLVGPGGLCDENRECRSGLYCRFDDHRCNELPKEGEGCDWESGCAGEAECIQGICRLAPPEGSPCGPDECGESAVCEEGRCKRLYLPGEPCDADDDCMPDFFLTGGAWCDGSVCHYRVYSDAFCEMPYDG